MKDDNRVVVAVTEICHLRRLYWQGHRSDIEQIFDQKVGKEKDLDAIARYFAPSK